jgi:hypothetical protein
MIDSINNFISKHAISLFTFAIVISCLASMYQMIDITRKPPELKDFKGGVQNHLVWSTKGECFFVRPYSTETVYLIRVEDCDKPK